MKYLRLIRPIVIYTQYGLNQILYKKRLAIH